ncbi:hypothetical protein ACGFR8_17855 [Streptomyces brevispora]|uniref:hypothetical protein n=1 Tax=Streptomyces brevispora TaxID=887462 RepID=UPI00371EA0CB
MGEDLEVVAVTAGVNALAGLFGSMDWSQIGGRIRSTLSRRGRDADPDVVGALESEDDGERAQRLAVALNRLPAEDLDAVTRDLETLAHRTEVNIHGGKNAVIVGSGDQNVTFN